MSDDGALAIVVIVLMGNPFSADYARDIRRGAGAPLRHCAVNVALYGRRASWWALRERALRPADVTRSAILLGSTRMEWRDDALVVDFDERTTPLARRLRGRVRVVPAFVTDLELRLDAKGAHRWRPVAPLATIEVCLDEPSVSFRGHGYADANEGDAPLEAAFARWSWARARVDRDAAISYAAMGCEGAARAIGLRVRASGAVDALEGLTARPLPRSRWGIERDVLADPGEPARVLRDLEDGPFYTRSLVETRLGGRRVAAVHETLAAHRLRRGWVRFLARFRTGRAPA